MRKTWMGALAALGVVALIYGCTQSSARMADATVKGVIEDRDGTKVANATVWLIPAGDVAAMGKTPIEIKRDARNDEPLEDNLAANRDRYLKGKSGADGSFSVAGVPVDGKYFLYVEPADATYLPGGDKSRKSLNAADMAAAPVKIQVSGNTPAGATHAGTSKCLDCHEEHESFKGTLHRLGIQVVGKPSKLQNFSRFPNYNQGLDKLMAGAKFWFYGYDKTRSFDKYQISDKEPADPASVSFTATFYKDADGKLKFRTENAKDTSDPARVYPVEVAYGGGL